MLTHTGTLTMETDRLILRKFEYSDIPDMLKNWVADREVQPLYCEPIYSTEEAVRGLLDRYIGGYAQPDYYRWAIIEKDCGECIGQTSFFLMDNKNHFAEMEYCIGTAYQKKGYATEAAKAVIHFGFEAINLNKVQICHKSTNEPSSKVIRNCGFHYDGNLRDYFYDDGIYVDRLYYSILKREYEAL